MAAKTRRITTTAWAEIRRNKFSFYACDYALSFTTDYLAIAIGDTHSMHSLDGDALGNFCGASQLLPIKVKDRENDSREKVLLPFYM